jgi:hypothetical protein
VPAASGRAPARLRRRGHDARLLKGVAGLGGQRKRCRQLGAGGGGLACPVQSLRQAAERLGFAVPLTDLPEQGERRPEQVNGLLVFATAQPDLTQAEERVGHTGPVFDAAEDDQRLLDEIGSLGQFAAARRLRHDLDLAPAQHDPRRRPHSRPCRRDLDRAREPR